MWLPRSESNQALKQCGYHALRATRLWNNVVTMLWEQPGFETVWLPRSESNQVLKKCGYHTQRATRFWNNVVTTLWEQPEEKKKRKIISELTSYPTGGWRTWIWLSNMSNAADRSSSLYSTETFILLAKVNNLLVTRTKSVSVEWFILYAHWCMSKSSCKDTLRWLAPLRQKWTGKLTWKCRKCTINLVCRLCMVGLSISVQQKDFFR